MNVKIPYKGVVYLLRVDKDYICISCDNAKPLKGETHIRGSDVVDGHFEDLATVLQEWAEHAKQEK